MRFWFNVIMMLVWLSMGSAYFATGEDPSPFVAGVMAFIIAGLHVNDSLTTHNASRERKGV